ncbi:hypothetical protein [Fluviicola sp.]|uniref:hypothetical protein n=1 Tax=Fluviicola sp. TaxID=1917219 RepID=UPI0031E0E316
MNKNETNALEIIKSDSSFITEASDSIIHLLNDSNVVDDIPIIGLITKLGKIGFGLSNHLFEKKLYSFLFEIKDTTLEERNSFIKKLDEKEYSEIGNSITILLEKYDSLTKAKYLGMLLKASIKEEITNETFMRIALIINRLMVFDIQKLPLFLNEIPHTGNYVIELENQGLIEKTGLKMQGQNSHTNYWIYYYRLSNLGTVMVIKLKLYEH